MMAVPVSRRIMRVASRDLAGGNSLSCCTLGGATVPVRERMLVDLVTSSGRASTGNPGLDDILGGGLTPDRLYLVEGTPGTGKTTLALQFLMEGVRLGVPALYITLSEQPMSCAPSPNLTVGLSTAYRCSSARVPLAALRCVPVKYSGTKSRAVVARLTRRR